MNNNMQQDEGHRTKRAGLRALGIVLVICGGLLTAIGIGNFFYSFGSFGPPRYFWCAFLGLPMLGFGSMLCQFGFMGSIMRFQAKEMTPVARDAFNEMAHGTRGGVKTMAHALGAGLSSGMAGGTRVACPSCGTENDDDAKFCDNCGTSLEALKCPSCQHANDIGARFCDQCGAALT